MKLGNINKFGGDLSKVVSKLGDTVQVLKSSFMPSQSRLHPLGGSCGVGAPPSDVSSCAGAGENANAAVPSRGDV